MTSNNTRTIALSALGLVAAVALVAALAMGAQVSSDTVTISDSNNETVSANISWSGNADSETVDVFLNDTNGSIITNTTIAGNASETKEVTLDPDNIPNEDYNLNISSTDATNTTLVNYSVLGFAQLSSERVPVMQPDNASVTASVDFISNNTNATVNVSSNGSVIDSTEIEGNASETKSVTLDPSNVSNGEFGLNLYAEDAANVTLNKSTLSTTRKVAVDNKNTSELLVDVGFNSTQNATATVIVRDSNGGQIYDEVLTYTADNYADNSGTLSLAINDSDGLVNDTVSVEVLVNNASAYEDTYASLSTDSTTGGGLLGGSGILGQDPLVAAGALLVVAGGWRYYKMEMEDG